jgi:hypothetical protein
MNNRVLLKEIPPKKFHSAIFTTYSINMYYLEQQVLPLLGSKEIHYISILVDSEMLSNQLDSYSFMSEDRKRTYALNGIKSSGAFHPKIIFLAGDSNLLLLIGSGNLTSSGHGKNLEVWNAFFVESINDPKLGLLIQAWNYLKRIQDSLGASFSRVIKNIEGNCSLLQQVNEQNILSRYRIDNNMSVSFLYSQPTSSLFSQLVSTLSQFKIKKITIMSPFYDIEGRFLQLLNDTFNPKRINIILQRKFGNAPVKIDPKPNMRFYDWENVKFPSVQKFFHAKNIIFECDNTNFLLSGSANASIAAFGIRQVNAKNYEASILYQSDETNFINLLGIRLGEEETDLSLYHETSNTNQITEGKIASKYFINYAERNYDKLTVQLSLENATENNPVLCIHDAKGALILEKELELQNQDNKYHITISQSSSSMYCYIKEDELIVSNKQFIVDINAFESTNPSQKNRSLNQLRKIIENEGLSTLKIINYLSTVSNVPSSKKHNIAAQKEKQDQTEIVEVDNDLLYLSYREIQSKVKHFDNMKNPKAYVDYNGVRLWDSVISYLRSNREKEEQSKFDEEETEDPNKSTGKQDTKTAKPQKPISRKEYDTNQNKVEKFLEEYIQILESKTSSGKSEQPSIVDLAMYLISIEILLQYAYFKKYIVEDKTEEYIIKQEISHTGNTWSGFILKIIGLFTLWSNQSDGFKDIDNLEYKDMFNQYKTDAFYMSVLSITLFNHVNRNNFSKKIEIFSNIELLNSLHCFSDNKVLSFKSDDYLMYWDRKHETPFVNSIIKELIRNIKFLGDFIKQNQSRSRYIFQKGAGYMYYNTISGNVTSNRSLIKINPYSLFLH